ncbi:hypothetical protein R6Q57_017795 [Mikania cordata]
MGVTGGGCRRGWAAVVAGGGGRRRQATVMPSGGGRRRWPAVFFPSHLSFSVQDLCHCAVLPPPSSALPPPSDEIQHRQIRQQDVILQSGVIKRNFNTYGTAA